jgi:hypothetical protein
MLPASFAVGGRLVGDGQPTYVIAEAGSNHNRDLGVARRLIDVESLCGLSRRLGFEPVDVQADFPMELFLLMGLDYVGDPSMGSTCHAYRVEAERSLAPEARRALFRSFAAAGVGRNARLLARKVAEQDRPSELDHGLPVERGGYRYVPLRRADIASRARRRGRSGPRSS